MEGINEELVKRQESVGPINRGKPRAENPGENRGPRRARESRKPDPYRKRPKQGEHAEKLGWGKYLKSKMRDLKRQKYCLRSQMRWPLPHEQTLFCG